MTDPTGWQLIEDWRNGVISDDDFVALQDLLREDPEARQTLRRSMTMDSALRDRAEAELLAVEADTEVVGKQTSDLSASNRPRWLSAAALIAVELFAGCLCTGVAWAYANANSVSSIRLPVSLWNGGFESETESAASGYPDGPGFWSGDQVEVVESGHQGVSSFEGQRMLRFVQTWGDEPERRGARSNQWQIVELSGVETGGEKLMATLTARFNRIDAGPDTDTVFRIEIQAFSGDPSTAETQYDSDSHLSGTVLKKSTDGDPLTWEELEVTTSVPPETDFLLIGFYAHEDVVDDPPTAPEFAGHYVDGVELELSTINP